MTDQNSFSKNFFQLLALPISYEVDVDKLQSAYLKLQRQFHPDRFAGSSSQEQMISIQFIAQLNEAKNCLLDDVQRGRYMLTLKNQEMPEEQTISDMNFLMQQIEWREEIECLNKNDSQEQRQDFQRQMKQEYKKYYVSFSKAFDSENWQNAKLELAKLQFMQKILKELQLS